MVKINDNQYDNYQVKVTWENFNISNENGQKRLGEAPFICFYLENSVIGLEFTFSKKMFLNAKIDVEVNIKEYISDIVLDNGEGWKSLILKKYDCNITRINEKTFNLNFYTEEDKIFINTDIDLF